MVSDINLIKIGNSFYFKRVRSKKDVIHLGDEDGYYIDTSGDEKEARRIIDTLKSKKKLIALEGNTNQFNRRALETMKINYLVSPEKYEKHDNLKQRDSGFNHVTAKIAAKNKISILVDAGDLRTLDKKEKAERLSRVIQNINECRKARCGVKIVSLSGKDVDVFSKDDRLAIMQTLGASSKQASESVKF